ncbi:uncharacterized protein [Dysidea avara]|uniref:uncharacterized protein n=1 Tax=Dysidea avara TaxID=196820 RepID=UPI00332FD515
MKNLFLGVALFVFMVAVCEAHLCLFNPQQRGTMNGINAAGSNDCILLDGPCGGRKAMKPTVGIMAGVPYTVVFQKNLDHFNTADPGMFVVSVGENSASPTFKQVGMVMDSGTPSLHVYTMNVTFPKVMSDGAVVQVKYVTNNKQAPAVFYQCADIMMF